MKKLLFVMAAAAMVLGAASCTKTETLNAEKTGKRLDKITVTIEKDATKLTLDESNGKLCFAVNDTIFSWDESANYTYICTSVDAGGNAIFETTTPELTPIAYEGAEIFMIYAPDYNVDDISDKNVLKIDISEFEGSEFSDLPVVMTAKGIVDAEGGCSLVFKNAVAPIKVTDAVMSGAANTTFDKVWATGLYPKISYSIDADNKLVVTPDIISSPVANLTPFTTDASAKASFWLASFITPKGVSAGNVTFTAFTGNDEYTSEAGQKTINAGEFIKYSGKTFTKAGGVMEIGSTVYNDMGTAVDAINSATSPITAKFLKNVALQDSIIITNMKAEITLDLNGKVILAPDAQAAGLKIQGGSSVVNIIDSKGGGKIDHTVAATTPTVVVDGGTLNLISGSICNTTGGGYGRIAVTVSAQRASATFNVKGGAVIGSRAILVGSGISSNLSSLYVYDGLVQGITTSSGAYPAIGNSDYGGYAHVEVLGGTVMTTGAKAKAVIHIKKEAGVDVIIGGAAGKTPYLFNAMKNALVTGSNEDCEATYTIHDLYGNISTNKDEETEVFGNCDITPVNPPVVDPYGNSYVYRIKKK